MADYDSGMIITLYDMYVCITRASTCVKGPLHVGIPIIYIYIYIYMVAIYVVETTALSCCSCREDMGARVSRLPLSRPVITDLS